jgi:hypothetical protein
MTMWWLVGVVEDVGLEVTGRLVVVIPWHQRQGRRSSWEFERRERIVEG